MGKNVRELVMKSDGRTLGEHWADRQRLADALAVLRQIRDYECNCCAGDCGCGYALMGIAKDALVALDPPED